jgi:hypothetical protein
MFYRNVGELQDYAASHPKRHSHLCENLDPTFYYLLPTSSTVSRDSIIGIAAGCGLNDRGVGVRVAVATRFSSSPGYPDRFLGSPSLLSNGYRGFFPGVKAAGA